MPRHPVASETSRRQFLLGCGAAAVTTAYCRADGDPAVNPQLNELTAILSEAGYDGSTGNCALLAVISDPHIFLGSEYPQYRTEMWDGGLIDEINSLSSLVTDVVVSGDVITYHSMTPGLPPYGSHLDWSKEEYRIAKSELQRFNRPIWVIPGNHDTDAYESDAQLFREELGLPAYQKAEIAGVAVFFLNSGTGGMIDPVQRIWLQEEATALPKEQEVLIFVHHPPFFALYEQAGVKRVIVEAFRNHSATIWVSSGHAHAFAEGLYSFNKQKYVQTQITTANRTPPFSDNRNPGYGLFALQNGRVIKRVFRSLKEVGYQSRAHLAQMTPKSVEFPFDLLNPPMGIYNEGFYDRSGKVTSYSGVDVGCYITYCKMIELKLHPDDYMGRVSHFVMAGTVANKSLPVATISATGADGTWQPLVFPAPKGTGLYEIPIPPEFADGQEFHLRFDTGKTASLDGFNFCGWALKADETLLDRYMKWISTQYRTLEKCERTSASFITPGTSLPNIVNFGFNLQPTDSSEVTGMPQIGMNESVGRERLPTVTFARMNEGANPGISYVLESCDDLESWTAVAMEDFEEIIVRTTGDWSEVRHELLNAPSSQGFYRMRLYALP